MIAVSGDLNDLVQNGLVRVDPTGLDVQTRVILEDDSEGQLEARVERIEGGRALLRVLWNTLYVSLNEERGDREETREQLMQRDLRGVTATTALSCGRVVVVRDLEPIGAFRLLDVYAAPYPVSRGALRITVGAPLPLTGDETVPKLRGGVGVGGEA